MINIAICKEQCSRYKHDYGFSFKDHCFVIYSSSCNLMDQHKTSRVNLQRCMPPKDCPYTVEHEVLGEEYERVQKVVTWEQLKVGTYLCFNFNGTTWAGKILRIADDRIYIKRFDMRTESMVEKGVFTAFNDHFFVKEKVEDSEK